MKRKLFFLLVATLFLSACGAQPDSGQSQNTAEPEQTERVVEPMRAALVLDIRDQRVDFTQPEWHFRHEQASFLPDQDSIVFFYPGAKWVEFLDSLSVRGEADCLIFDEEKYCATQDELVKVILNGEEVAFSELSEIHSGDRLLIYVGEADGWKDVFREVPDVWMVRQKGRIDETSKDSEMRF